MKKMMMFAALMLLSVSTAFAGNSDALKAILKADSYTEAAKLIQSSLDQLASNAEKATAYNKVVDLALDKFSDESTKQQAKLQYDEAGMNDALEAAFDAAEECEKYDVLPNEKGKVKPRYDKVNALRLYRYRPYLINAGISYQNTDKKRAYKLLSYYINSNEDPLFAEVKTDSSKDPNFTIAAYCAGTMALATQDYENAEKYSEMALTDSVYGESALQNQIYAMKAQLKTADDSLKFIDKCKALYEKHPDNVAIFANLVDAYSAAGQVAESEKLVDDRLAKKPNDFIALWVKGQFQFNRSQYNEATETLQKALAEAPDNQRKILVNAKLGDCYFFHASERLDKIKGVMTKAVKDQFMPYYENAIKYYEAAKALDTDQSQKSYYAARLYVSYYRAYGEADSRTEEAKGYAGY